MHLHSRINIRILITSCCCTAPHCETLQILTGGKEETTTMKGKNEDLQKSSSRGYRESDLFPLLKWAVKPKQEGMLCYHMSLPREFQEAMKEIPGGRDKKEKKKVSSIEKGSNIISKILNVIPCNDVQELWSENCLL